MDRLFLTVFILITLVPEMISSNQSNQNHTILENNMKTGNYKTGDCFEFKNDIKDFGLIFLEEKNYPDGKQYNLFPVKLDTTKTGLNKFKYGKVYITGFPDLTKSSGRTDGFMVYSFLYQKDFTILNRFFKLAGSLHIKDTYMHATGGTMASSMAEFRTQLNHWENMFGENGQLVTVIEISQ